MSTVSILMCNQSQKVIIHVTDLGRKLKKDYSFSKDVLLKNMKFFSAYIGNQDEEEMSINCDSLVFEFLITFINEPAKVVIGKAEKY